MAGLLDSVDVKLIGQMERLVKMFATMFPLVFCQLPNTKIASVNDKLLLPRMKDFLRQLTVLLIALSEYENNITIIAQLIKKPEEFWGCVELFDQQ